jgi:hypothetical protein
VLADWAVVGGMIVYADIRGFEESIASGGVVS